jgi:transposase InsO family protein
VTGVSAHPDSAWITQQARNLAVCETTPASYLIHDRDSKCAASFDEVLRTEGVKVIRTPIRSPRANAFAERWVRTVRTECLDWTLVCAAEDTSSGSFVQTPCTTTTGGRIVASISRSLRAASPLLLLTNPRIDSSVATSSADSSTSMNSPPEGHKLWHPSRLTRPGCLERAAIGSV